MVISSAKVKMVDKVRRGAFSHGATPIYGEKFTDPKITWNCGYPHDLENLHFPERSGVFGYTYIYNQFNIKRIFKAKFRTKLE
jgi:hypothetical protein